jgi:hypothetical protein
MFATRMGSLIEAVNILGSVFYGTMLGIFLVAFYMKKVGANAVFIAGVITEIMIVILFVLDMKKVFSLGFIWLTVIGSLSVMVLAWGIEKATGKGRVVNSQ